MDVHAYTLRERATPESRRDETFTEPGMGDVEGVLPSKWFHGKEGLHPFLASDLHLLVIALPLTTLTRGMIGKEELETLGKKKAYVSNVGRGAIIKSADLIEALDKEVIRGAALDVTDPEPLPEGHPLWKAKNIMITPHVSGNSNHYNERVLKILAYNLERMKDGSALTNVVDRGLGY
jgi:phosphoglycerate dehydrogenase-like enzyme